MKFGARVRFTDDENGQALMEAFFNEFRLGSGIMIKNRKAVLEINFEEGHHPTQIPSAIGAYEDIQFEYGEISEEARAWLEDTVKGEQEGDIQIEHEGKPSDEVAPNQEDPESPEAEAETNTDEAVRPHEEPEVISVAQNEELEENDSAYEQSPIQAEESPNEADKNASTDEEVPEQEDVPTPQDARGKRSKKAPDEIPELEKIAQTVVSFDAYVEAVAEWLEVGKRKEYFINLVQVAIAVDKVSWGKLNEGLKQKGIELSQNDKIALTRQISKKLTEIQSDGGILSVIKLTAKYANFDFQSNAEKRVKSILMDMGLETRGRCTVERDLILKIACKGLMVNLDEVKIDEICVAAGIEDEDDVITHARMTFAQFVNDFYRKYNKEMTATQFLKELQEMIFEGKTLF